MRGGERNIEGIYAMELFVNLKFFFCERDTSILGSSGRTKWRQYICTNGRLFHPQRKECVKPEEYQCPTKTQVAKISIPKHLFSAKKVIHIQWNVAISSFATIKADLWPANVPI